MQATATSLASQKLARQVGIPLLESRRGLRVDLTVEGTDELDAQPRLVKGGGATLLREKVLAPASDYLLIIADFSKGGAPGPVFVVPQSRALRNSQCAGCGSGFGRCTVLRPGKQNASQSAGRLPLQRTTRAERLAAQLHEGG